MTNKLFTLLLVALSTTLWTSEVHARPERVGQIPNGNLISCSACHVNPGGGGTRNLFGQLVERQFLSGGAVVWGPQLARLDADGDGVPNGAELQDPYGQWSTGQPAPGNSAWVSLPGVTADRENATLTVQFSGMNPHIGQGFGARVIDNGTGKEVARFEEESIATAEFSVPFTSTVRGRSYRVEFFADFNGNDFYDAPPTDHAWLIEVGGITQDTTVTFAHNTDFAEIGWTYMTTLNLHSMTQNIGQMLEARVIDVATGAEAGRARIDVLSAADASMRIPGLMPGGSYQLDLYADFNRNGFYNAPSTDQAWRMTFTNPAGNATVEFTRNTTFTDVEWPTEFQLNLLGFSPHLGQLVEFRIHEELSGDEIGRVSLSPLTLANRALVIPGIRNGISYYADFYADFNGNGSYDSPPTDHAWRIAFSGNGRDLVHSFTHNTNFTDIEWPTAAVEDPDVNNPLPSRYILGQNYPNPFNPSTAISFSIPQHEMVTLKVFSLLGEEVATLVDAPLAAAGEHTTLWQPSGLASGIYFYRLTAGNFTDAKRLVLMK